MATHLAIHLLAFLPLRRSRPSSVCGVRPVSRCLAVTNFSAQALPNPVLPPNPCTLINPSLTPCLPPPPHPTPSLPPPAIHRIPPTHRAARSALFRRRQAASKRSHRGNPPRRRHHNHSPAPAFRLHAVSTPLPPPPRRPPPRHAPSATPEPPRRAAPPPAREQTRCSPRHADEPAPRAGAIIDAIVAVRHAGARLHAMCAR